MSFLSAAATVSDYGYSIGLLLRFLDQRQITDNQSVTASTLADFQSWVYYQPTRQATPRGVVNQNGILAGVKSFCRFLRVEGYLAADPAEAIEYAREPRSLPRNVLTPQEAKRIIESVDTTTVLGYRDRTILEVLYATGRRRSAEWSRVCSDRWSQWLGKSRRVCSFQGVRLSE